ncbi:MAG: hypothetical protein M3010_03235, partial [Candidatus Dormibacteraeota bacterium]|nr:hypothetical protein [Candidatus Dormibacteraeota bacterium]
MTQLALDPAAAARRLLENSEAAETEVLVADGHSSLTRFANSEIHQNVTERSAFLRVRIVDRERVGVASTNQFDDESLRQVLDQARAIARAQEPRSDLPSLPGPVEVSPSPPSNSTASST